MQGRSYFCVPCVSLCRIKKEACYFLNKKYGVIHQVLMLRIQRVGFYIGCFLPRNSSANHLPEIKNGDEDSGRHVDRKRKHSKDEEKAANLTHPSHIIKRPTDTSFGIEIPSPTQRIIFAHKNLIPPSALRISKKPLSRPRNRYKYGNNIQSSHPQKKKKQK